MRTDTFGFSPLKQNGRDDCQTTPAADPATPRGLALPYLTATVTVLLVLLPKKSATFSVIA